MKDIEQLFQSSRERVNERPRADVWDRLESRLDNRQAPATRFTFVKYAAAASVFFALVASAVLFRNLDKNANGVADNQVQTTQVETKTEAPQSEKAQEEHSEVLTEKTITAVQPKMMHLDPAVVPLPTIARREMYDDVTNDAEGVTPEADNKALAIDAYPEVARKDAAPSYSNMDRGMTIEDAAISRSNMSYSYPTAPKFESKELKTQEAKAEMEDAKTVIAERNLADYAYEDNAGVAKESNAKRSKKVKGKASDKVVQNASPTAPVIGKIAEKPSTLLQTFAWMTGEWHDETRGDGNNNETWAYRNPQTLEGKGYYMLQQDTLFEERLTILQDGSDVYFVSNVDQLNRRIRYRLTYINGNRYTFEQNAIAEAPNQVILEKKDGGNGFTLEMNYNGKNAYTRDQTMYMTNRNFVDKNKAVRNLKRSMGKK